MTTIAQNINDLKAFGRIGEQFFAYFSAKRQEKAYSLGKGKMHVATITGDLAAVEIEPSEAKELFELATLHNIIAKQLANNPKSWVCHLA